MAKRSLIEKNKRVSKFVVRNYNRCNCCGRARSFMRKFGLCRICFREKSLQGIIPGIKKASW